MDENPGRDNSLCPYQNSKSLPPEYKTKSLLIYPNCLSFFEEIPSELLLYANIYEHGDSWIFSEYICYI
jgi:hypothetical protein